MVNKQGGHVFILGLPTHFSPTEEMVHSWSSKLPHNSEAGSQKQGQRVSVYLTPGLDLQARHSSAAVRRRSVAGKKDSRPRRTYSRGPG